MSDGKRSGGNAKKKNVQVAVRIRPLNEREKVEGARAVVTANTVTGYIGVRERSSKKEFGPFDKVYDASCRQHDIYEALVKPLIPQLLLGYNATIFAYGQTGTGKTFTMAGEADPEYNGKWQDDPGMGIIPRALEQLFEELEKQNAEEYSVRVSYVELYNEELFDLLARPGSENRRLRIFDDNTRKGSVIISGAEDVSVQNSEDVYEILRKGAEKRRTAATLMNMSSSRSHSVFTVTVVTREGKLAGEDLMKTGKLHLVDLAGSENIGRSGAIEQRAREAGNINQSLLTLGRVITALTSGAAHVPYRESKLTRILQDSLGGKTITTIIATLSPSSTSTEESINTLEYASRAKNIKNHPEANQSLSRRALLKAYNDEVERLKRDLQAAREKNGVFVDKDNFEKMQEELDAQRDQIAEFTDRIQAYMSQIEKLMCDVSIMDEQYSKLYDRSSKLESKLKERLAEIEQLNLKLAEAESSREMWKRAAEEVQDKFHQLQEQFSQLTETCRELSIDLDGAHSKIKRLTELIKRNDICLKDLEENHTIKTVAMNENIAKWKQEVSTDCGKVVDQCEKLQALTRSRISVAQQSLNMLGTEVAGWSTSVLSALENSRKSIINVNMVYSEAEQKTLGVLDGLLNEYFSKVLNCNQKLNDALMAVSKQQSYISRTFEDFVEQHEIAKLETLEKRRDMIEKEEARIKSFQNKIISTIAGFVDGGMEFCGRLEDLEAKDNENRDASVKIMDQTVKKCSQELGLLVSTMGAENHNIESATTASKESANKSISETMGSIKSRTSDVEKETQLCISNMQSTVSEHVANLKTKHSELCVITEELVTTTEQSLCETAESASAVEQMNENRSEDLIEDVENLSGLVKKTIKDDIQRIVPSGHTPRQKHYQINNNPLDILDVEDMVSKWEGEEPPRRQSFYRRRESILENSSSVMSPQTLKGTLLSTVEEGCEDVDGPLMDHHSLLSNIPHEFPASNGRRRRVLRTLNSEGDA